MNSFFSSALSAFSAASEYMPVVSEQIASYLPVFSVVPEPKSKLTVNEEIQDFVVMSKLELGLNVNLVDGSTMSDKDCNRLVARQEVSEFYYIEKYSELYRKSLSSLDEADRKIMLKLKDSDLESVLEYLHKVKSRGSESAHYRNCKLNDLNPMMVAYRAPSLTVKEISLIICLMKAEIKNAACSKKSKFVKSAYLSYDEVKEELSLADRAA